MKLAVDVCIGKRGVRLLQEAGHEVVVVAQDGERDEVWFARALAAGAEAVIANDQDLNMLCYEARVYFIKAKQGLNGSANALRAIERISYGFSVTSLRKR